MLAVGGSLCAASLHGGSALASVSLCRLRSNSIEAQSCRLSSIVPPGVYHYYFACDCAAVRSGVPGSVTTAASAAAASAAAAAAAASNPVA